MKKLIGIAFVILLTTGCANSSYFNYASAYGGLDYTTRWASQCPYTGTPTVTGRDRNVATGNLGMKLNWYSWNDGKLESNIKWTHLSCAFEDDYVNYDAIGAEVEYKFWTR